jgi:hypothetical protein
MGTECCAVQFYYRCKCWCSEFFKLKGFSCLDSTLLWGHRQLRVSIDNASWFWLVQVHGCSVDVHSQWHLSSLGSWPGLAGERPQPTVFRTALNTFSFVSPHTQYVFCCQHAAVWVVLGQDLYWPPESENRVRSLAVDSNSRFWTSSNALVLSGDSLCAYQRWRRHYLLLNFLLHVLYSSIFFIATTWTLTLISNLSTCNECKAIVMWLSIAYTLLHLWHSINCFMKVWDCFLQTLWIENDVMVEIILWLKVHFKFCIWSLGWLHPKQGYSKSCKQRIQRW